MGKFCGIGDTRATLHDVSAIGRHRMTSVWVLVISKNLAMIAGILWYQEINILVWYDMYSRRIFVLKLIFWLYYVD